MADGVGQVTLEEVEAAAQPTRFALLGRRGWFTGSDAAADLEVKRGAVRQHARVLVRIGLATERQMAGAPRGTLEWQITDRGTEIRRRVARLVGQPYDRRPQSAPLAALLAVESPESPTDLADVLLGLAHTRVEVVPGYLVHAAPGGAGRKRPQRTTTLHAGEQPD